MRGRTVAVTGATGFIGGYAARALTGRGASVIAAVRSPSSARALVEGGVEVRSADLSDEDALTAAFTGADAVVAAAARVSFGGSTPGDVLRTNVEGTANVVRAAHRAGARHVLLVSSVGAYRPRNDRTWTEDDALYDDAPPTRWNAYRLSKAASERVARRLTEEHGLTLSIVRPGAVHGAFDRGTLSRWMARFLAPPVTVFPTRLHIPSAYAGDLAIACCRILERPEVAAGRAYNIAGDPDQTFWDLYEAYKEAGGRVPRLVLPIPVPFRWTWDTRRARRDLDFSNRPLVEGFREMIALERVAPR